MSTEIESWIASERQASTSAAEAAIRIEIEHVMSLTPVLPDYRVGGFSVDGLPRSFIQDRWHSDNMIIARRQQIETLLQLAMDAGPEVRARFAKEVK